MNRHERRSQGRVGGIAAADAARAAGRLAEAESLYRAVLARQPSDARALHGLALVALQAGQPGPAVALLQRAAATRPTADLLVDLGWALGLAGDRGGAMAAERRAIVLDPQHAQAHYNLACDLQEENRLVEAIDHYRRAVAAAPRHVDARNNLAQALVAAGAVEEAVAAFDAAVKAAPDDWALASNRLLALHYDPRIAPPALAAEHRAWAARHATLPRFADHANAPDPERPLRLGYLSPDLCRHPVGWFLQQALAHRDRAAFHVTAYSSRRAEDEVSAAIRGLVDRWRPVAALADEALAAQIRADGIDILVDLAGHTMGHRLRVMARRPAPVQASWIGWIDTTGLEAIDHFVTDAVEAPEGCEPLFAEHLVRLPVGAMCWTPPPYAPEVVPPPLGRGAPPTFGCFNNLAKVNDGVIALWARVLGAVPGSRLLLKSKSLGDPAVAEGVRARFAARGVTAERLALEGRSPHADMLARYGDIDVALDPFPYSGGLTSVEALWMGVPVVTRGGDRMVARQTAGYLTTLGRTEWIAPDADAYVATAAALVADAPGLASRRAGQRARMAASPLVDGARFVPALEAAWRAMWRDWCARR
ncbi:MAG: tetratricopeptide repeat protein [Alphaproteobacteria bacterium]|nr:tetratricopeptide repeat protein [Alphaproteobacteria bacterium]